MRMNRKKLEEMYYAFVDDLERNLETEGMNRASDAMYEVMHKVAPEFKDFSELEEKTLTYAGESQKYGFIAGFEECMSLFVKE